MQLRPCDGIGEPALSNLQAGAHNGRPKLLRLEDLVALEVFDDPRSALVVHPQLHNVGRSRAPGLPGSLSSEHLREIAIVAHHAADVDLRMGLLTWSWPDKLSVG